MGKDAIRQVRKILDEEMSRDPKGYIPREVAERVHERLKSEHPGLLEAWLHEQALYFLTRMVNDIDRSKRASTRASERSLDYREALRASAGGEGDTALLRFLSMPITVEDGSHQPLGSLRGPALRFAASGYERRAKENAFWARLLEGLAERVGDRRVDEVYSEEQLEALFKSARPE